jgi:hypothetical protein
MGVPNLYRWLSERYPLINRPVDETMPMPEIDNLYLDANGILHNATHGDAGESIGGRDGDMYIRMCSKIDSLVQLARPRRLLYIAIDGVAPRAKMNQQRQRRYRTARDRQVQRAKAAATAAAEAATAAPAAPAAPMSAAPEGAAEASLADAPLADTPEAAVEEVDAEFDSNCITPGTAFMSEVAAQLRYFIRYKIEHDALWRGLRIVLSGADCPGEGEHKIAQHIRSARERSRRHCIYGLDADLIMLALATHAPAVVILREKVVFRGRKSASSKAVSLRATGEYVLLHSDLLRRYLDLELRTLLLPFDFSLDRILNDLLLLSFLVGNDFLPHSPALAIEEDGLDRLFGSYKKLLPNLGGYLLEGVEIVPKRLQRLLADVAAVELEFLQAEGDPHEATHAKRPKPNDSPNTAPDATAPKDSDAAVLAAVTGKGTRATGKGTLKQTGGAAGAGGTAAAGGAAAAAAAAGGSAPKDAVTLPYEEKASASVHVPAVKPPPAPWAQAGGFSFAKVLMGQRIAAAAAKAGAEAAVDVVEEEGVAADGAMGTQKKSSKDGAASAPAPAPAPTPTPADFGAMLMSMLGVTKPSGEAASAAATVPVAVPPAPHSPAKPAVLPATAPAPATALSVLKQVEAALTSAAALAPWTLVDLEGLEEDARDSMLGEKLYA